MPDLKPPMKDAYTLILEAIDAGVYRPGDRLVESELAERLGVSPARCLAFEDSETGAEAAHRAGCTVVQVPDVGQATGRWAHHLARDLIDGAARAGLTAPAL